MFICIKCLEEKYLNAPSFFKSMGNCECCGAHKICNEIASKLLLPKITFGIDVKYNFLTMDEEGEILRNITQGKFYNQLTRNRILRYGSRVPYNNQMVSDEIPDFLKQLCIHFGSDSVTINEYYPGQSINFHIDSFTSGPVISIVSLKSTCTLYLRKEQELKKYELPARSLLTMKDIARYDWEHGIPIIEELRYSLVFRKSTAKK